ncbi:hypothetical protein RclHR1_00880005 [Rhizophagus clarus]|uniref:Uncharacterized protein n=1 Tax=Rhizophagus clarus TaxID=94130 RepID=A0A2Z6S4F0_9GLOM|nr:hypothetical protein RclHR1_00880005 [Rhizophagus clarus]
MVTRHPLSQGGVWSLDLGYQTSPLTTEVSGLLEWLPDIPSHNGGASYFWMVTRHPLSQRGVWSLGYGYQTSPLTTGCLVFRLWLPDIPSHNGVSGL